MLYGIRILNFYLVSDFFCLDLGISVFLTSFFFNSVFVLDIRFFIGFGIVDFWNFGLAVYL